MRFGLSAIAVTSIIIPLTTEAGDEIPLLPDAEYFRTAPAVSATLPVPSTPKPVPEPTTNVRRHPLLEKSSLFGDAARHNVPDGKSRANSLFARKALPMSLGRSLRFHRPSAELFPTLPVVHALPLPERVGVNQPPHGRETPTQACERPVILQSDFQEFPPLD